MKTNIFIAKTLWKHGSIKGLGSTSSLVAGISVAVSMIVMLLAIAISDGFKREIRDKAIGFSGGIVLSSPGIETTTYQYPVESDLSYIKDIINIPGVISVQSYACRSGIIKNGEEIQGILLKGVDSNYNWTFFKNSLVDGKLPDYSDSASAKEIMLSSRLAKMMAIKVGDPVQVYFVGDIVKARKFTLAGIYDAQLEEIDKTFVIANISEIQSLNGWRRNEVSGIEVISSDPDKLEETSETIKNIIHNKGVESDPSISVVTTMDQYPHLFDWLLLLDFNVLVVLIIMITVAGANMISGLLIILFEKISMIGLLKSLGMRDSSIHRIFLYRAMMIISRGMLAGNLIAFILLLLQQRFKIIGLDPVNYFVKYVPVHIDWFKMVTVNITAFLLIILLLYIPSRFISNISPDKSLRIK
ncbi:MAG: hypothetical protein ACD_77C00219G0011 [uncultured bacterium]|nr:MAG: hypothetical protein ACD_77C00219G0011 [uncultured bacterium]